MQAWRVTLLLALGSAGCASTSGRDWLEAPIEPRSAAVQSEAVLHALPAASIEARPRLNRTVTLGETYEPSRSASPAAAGASVQVNVNVPVVVNHPVGYGYAPYGYGYAPYGYGHARGYGASVSGAPVRSAPSAPQKVGGDFPAPPDYGPRALR